MPRSSGIQGGARSKIEAALTAEQAARAKAEIEAAALRQADQERRRLGLLARLRAAWRASSCLLRQTQQFQATCDCGGRSTTISIFKRLASGRRSSAPSTAHSATVRIVLGLKRSLNGAREKNACPKRDMARCRLHDDDGVPIEAGTRRSPWADYDPMIAVREDDGIDQPPADGIPSPATPAGTTAGQGRRVDPAAIGGDRMTDDDATVAAPGLRIGPDPPAPPARARSSVGRDLCLSHSGPSMTNVGLRNTSMTRANGKGRLLGPLGRSPASIARTSACAWVIRSRRIVTIMAT
jgi:hypothetical protein